MAEQMSSQRLSMDTFCYAFDNAEMNSDTEVCTKHPPEVLKYFCTDHDEPMCGDCLLLINHTYCTKVRVKDIADGFQTTEEYQSTQKKLDTFLKELGKMKDELEDDLKNIDTTFNTIQDKISSFRHQINVYLDEIQEQLTDETTNKKRIQETELKKLIAENESMKAELEDIHRSTQRSTGINLNSIFINTQRAKKRLVTMESEINQIVHSQQQHRQEYHYFKPSAGLQNLLSTKTPLGTLVRHPNIYTTASYRAYISTMTSWKIWNCSINSGTLISPDRLVVTDVHTDRIRLIDTNAQYFLTSFSASSVPWGVTRVSSDTIAVTFPDEEKIQMFEATSVITKICDIQVNDRCYDIAYKDGRFAVSFLYPNRIEILDRQGMVLHTIQPKQRTGYIYHDPFFIEFGIDNDTVIVSNYYSNKVQVVSFEGQILQTCTHDALQDPCGIGMTPGGVLFVCSWGSNSIHVVSQDFKKSKIIINDENRIKAPWTVTYCDNNQRLYICSRHGKEITIYDLHV